MTLQKSSWNSSDAAQKTHLVRILRAYIEELESEPMEKFVEDEHRQEKKKPAAKMKAPLKKKTRELQPV